MSKLTVVNFYEANKTRTNRDKPAHFSVVLEEPIIPFNVMLSKIKHAIYRPDLIFIKCKTLDCSDIVEEFNYLGFKVGHINHHIDGQYSLFNIYFNESEARSYKLKSFNTKLLNELNK